MFIMDKKILVVPKWFGNDPDHIRKLFDSERLDIYLKYYKSLFRPVYLHNDFTEVYIARQILDSCTWDLSRPPGLDFKKDFDVKIIEGSPKDGKWTIEFTTNEQPPKHKWKAEICKAK